VIVAHLDAATLAGVRLAPSPAMEAMAWLELTVTGGRHPLFGDPGAAARFALRDPDVAMIAKTFPAVRGYVPDLFTPQPARGRTDRIWSAQVEQIAETPSDVVAEQVAHTRGMGSPEVVAAVESGTFARRAANGFARFWAWAIDDGWSDLCERHERDLAARAMTMATEGIGGLLGSLHRDVRWTGTTLEVDKPYDETVHYAGQDFVLSPNLLSWPNLLVQLCDTGNAVLSYPAHGLGNGRPRTQDMSQLVGATRARLLLDLDVPRTTSDLSIRHRLAPATVSYHLSVMHGSGLVAKTRDKRSVLYRRTERGDALG
jgi:DNA-binding transcriptional ArsR family regulator